MKSQFAGHVIKQIQQHVESSICDRAMPFAVKSKTIMPNSNSLQASEGQWYLWSFVFQSIGFVLTKYHCPSPACKLLLLGIIVFGFTAKGIARSQIDDSTCLKILAHFFLRKLIYFSHFAPRDPVYFNIYINWHLKVSCIFGFAIERIGISILLYKNNFAISFVQICLQQQNKKPKV